MLAKNFHKVVRLLRNHLYPTYQLYAVMDSKKLKPMEGLTLGALTVLSWLRQRLGDDVPSELQAPEPEAYADFSAERLASAHLNYGFVIDIISLPEKGLWTLQITEPDLGSDPGNPQQYRKPVAGRIIETNVSFLAVGQELECGVQTVISDPENTPLAEVYRPAFVKKLYNHPDFGLKQVIALSPKLKYINTQERLARMLQLYHDKRNQLPCVIFTKEAVTRNDGLPLEGLSLSVLQAAAASGIEYDEQGNRLRPIRVEHELVDRLAPKQKSRAKENKAVKALAAMNAAACTELRVLACNPMERPKVARPAPKRNQELEYALPAYDIKRLAASFTGFAHVYLLEPFLLKNLRSQEGINLDNGDVLVLEPQCFKGGQIILPHKDAAVNESRLCSIIYNYPRGKGVDFGNLYFLSGARDALVSSTIEAKNYTSQQEQRFAVEQSVRDAQWQGKLTEKNIQLAKLENQLNKQAQQMNIAEQQLRQQKGSSDQLAERYEKRLAEKEAYIKFLQARVQRPHTKKELPAWVEKFLQARLILHARALNSLEAASLNADRLELLYDALEYLAMDFWESRYGSLSENELLTRASKKYQRGFAVTPNSDGSIAAYPGQYKIPGYRLQNGTVVTKALDYHLKTGNKAEHLVRIYFFFDDERQKIVVGSLPEHLDTVSF